LSVLSWPLIQDLCQTVVLGCEYNSILLIYQYVGDTLLLHSLHVHPPVHPSPIGSTNVYWTTFWYFK